ncbi:hypothetical protein [Aquamicrobium sp. LC103]|uniref:hypothetical protein n=1 Tax=Aquamicrobium sp. LC103 TaxID=1120658 RepID=UPI00063E6CFA|nr:hypothetical protein [Aquamicrobium sp. LC103]TKT80006.1 hypothetical protein XW59_006500 [Aquamicrobium sp. LC103]
MTKRAIVKKQLAQRKAVAAHLERVFISSKLFHRHGMTARVIVDGNMYEVGETDLKRLQAGRTPQDLELYPIMDED